jgi:hypothetical protein
MPRSSESKNNTNFHYYYLSTNALGQQYKKYFKTLEDVSNHFNVSKFTINRKIKGLNTKNKMLNSIHEIKKCCEPRFIQVEKPSIEIVKLKDEK